jgi:hypothetical protein
VATRRQYLPGWAGGHGHPAPDQAGAQGERAGQEAAPAARTRYGAREVIEA